MQQGYLQLTYLADLPLDTIQLVRAEGRVQLNGDYEFKLELFGHERFVANDLLGKLVQWRFSQEDGSLFAGYVKSLSINQALRTVLHLSSTRIFLNNYPRSRIYKNINFPALVKLIATENPLFLIKTEFKFQAYPVQEAWTQYEESDFDFLRSNALINKCYFYSDINGSICIKEERSFSDFDDLDTTSLMNLKFYRREGLSRLSFSSYKLFKVGQFFGFKDTPFIIQRCEYQSVENKLQNDHGLKNSLFCRVFAVSVGGNERFMPEVLAPLQWAKIIDDPYFDPAIKLASLVSWDEKNTYSYQSGLAQIWCGENQGLQFVPARESKIILSFREANFAYPLAVGVYAESDFSQFQGIKTQKHRLSINDNLELKTQGNESKEIGGDYKEIIQKSWQFKFNDFWELLLSEGSVTFNARNFKCQVGHSQLELNEAGIKLTANLIELCTPLGRNVGLARVHDYHFCPLLNPDLSPHVGGHIEEGCDSVLVNGLPAVRVRDHAVCMGNQDVIAEGVEDLSIAKQAAATGSSTSWHGGAITECSLNVISTTKSCATFANQSHSAIPLAERWLSVQEL